MVQTQTKPAALLIYKKKQFRVSGFSGVWNLALGGGKRRRREKELPFGGSRMGCDMFCPIQEPKWKSWLREDQP